MIYTRNPEHCKAYLRKCLFKYAVLFLLTAAFCFLCALFLQMNSRANGKTVPLLPVFSVSFAFLVVVFGLIALYAVRSLKKMYLTLEIDLTDEYIERRCAGFTVRIPFSELRAVLSFKTFADGESLKVCGKDWVAIGIPHDIA